MTITDKQQCIILILGFTAFISLISFLVDIITHDYKFGLAIFISGILIVIVPIIWLYHILYKDEKKK